MINLGKKEIPILVTTVSHQALDITKDKGRYMYGYLYKKASVRMPILLWRMALHSPISKTTGATTWTLFIPVKGILYKYNGSSVGYSQTMYAYE